MLFRVIFLFALFSYLVFSAPFGLIFEDDAYINEDHYLETSTIRPISYILDVSSVENLGVDGGVITVSVMRDDVEVDANNYVFETDSGGRAHIESGMLVLSQIGDSFSLREEGEYTLHIFIRDSYMRKISSYTHIKQIFVVSELDLQRDKALLDQLSASEASGELDAQLNTFTLVLIALTSILVIFNFGQLIYTIKRVIEHAKLLFFINLLILGFLGTASYHLGLNTLLTLCSFFSAAYTLFLLSWGLKVRIWQFAIIYSFYAFCLLCLLVLWIYLLNDVVTVDYLLFVLVLFGIMMTLINEVVLVNIVYRYISERDFLRRAEWLVPRKLKSLLSSLLPSKISAPPDIGPRKRSR